MELASVSVLIAATVTMGLFAGVFYTFSALVMIGLRKTDDRTFIGAMQAINAAPGPWFAIGIIAPGALTVAAIVLRLLSPDRSAIGWMVAALALYALGIGVITFAGNIPLNNALAAAGDPDRITDRGRVRRAFEEPWIRWNTARALAGSGALLCHAIALTRL